MGLLQLLLRSRRAQPLPAGRAPDATAAAYSVSVTVSNVSVSGVGNDTVGSVSFGNVTVSRVSVGNLAAAAVSSGNAVAVAVAVGNANGRVYLGRADIAVPAGRR